MKNEERFGAPIARAAAVLAVGAAAVGCTAGEVTYNGQAIRQHAGIEYAVAFWDSSSINAYVTDVTWGAPGYQGLPTFSFDTHGPDAQPGANANTVANRPVSIPPGEYYVVLYAVDRTTPEQPTSYFVSRHFDHEYASRGRDAYDGSQVPEALYELQVLPSYGTSDLCPAPVNHGWYTTIPVCFNSYESALPMASVL